MMSDDCVLYVPTRADIADIAVGGLALSPFGKLARVTAVTARHEDVKGKLFCCYYVEFGPTSQISHSQKEGELVRHIGTSARYTSHELDDLERKLTSV